MARYFLFVLAILFVVLNPQPAMADPAPGAACSPNGAFIRVGGSEAAAVGHMMVCVAGVWQSFLSFDGAGKIATGATTPNDQLHVVGQIRVDNDTNATNKGCIRFDGAGNKLQFSHDCSTFTDMGSGGGGSGGGLTLLATLTTTSGANQSATSLPASDALFLVFRGVGASGITNIQVAISANNGSSYSTAQTVASASASSIHDGTVWITGTGAAGSKVGVYSVGSSGGALNGASFVESTVTGVINAVRVSVSGGTLDAGSVYIFGLNGGGGGSGDNLGDHTATTNIQLGSNWLSGDGGNEGIFVSNTGVVGVGTSTPQNTLHIQREGVSAGQIVETNNATGRSIFNMRTSSGDSTTKTAVVSGRVLAEFSGQGYDGANYQEAGALYVTADGAVSSGIVPGRIGLFTSDAAGAPQERMRITSTGNVGIKETFPQESLHVMGNIRVDNDTNTTNKGCIRFDGTGNKLQFSHDCTTFTDMGTAAGDNLGNHTATSNIILGSNWLSGDGGNEGITIDSNGNVGVGVTPSAKIHATHNAGMGGHFERSQADDAMRFVAQVARTRSDATAPGAGFGGALVFGLEGFTDNTVVQPSSIKWGWEAAQTDDTTSRDSFISFNTTLNNTASGQGGSERMRIDSNGNVGIGNALPQTKLDITGTVKIGNGAEACSAAAHEGAIRYVAATDAFQMCRNSATGWEAIGTGGGSADNLGNHTATQALNMATFKVTGMGTPTVPTDAATKAYVDSLTDANESDPQVGTLTGAKWCAANAGGTAIECTQNAPSGGGSGTFTRQLDSYASPGSFTWTKPTGASMVYVECWGGGGSGGRHSSGVNRACGGGGGAYGRAWLAAGDLAATVTVTVGGGGASMTVNGVGNRGGNCCCGTYLISAGGIGGGYDSNGGTNPGCGGGTGAGLPTFSAEISAGCSGCV